MRCTDPYLNDLGLNPKNNGSHGEWKSHMGKRLEVDLESHRKRRFLRWMLSIRIWNPCVCQSIRYDKWPESITLDMGLVGEIFLWYKEFVIRVNNPRCKVYRGKIPMRQGFMTRVDNPRCRAYRGKMPWFGFWFVIV